MNNRWRKEDGKPWFPAEDRRAHKRFQRHVRTPSQPKKRIRREPCFVVFMDKRRRVRYKVNCDCMEAEFHHVDYEQPFRGVWACNQHHRMIDHGSLPYGQSDIWDYSSLVRQMPKVQKTLKRRPKLDYKALLRQPPPVPTRTQEQVDAASPLSPINPDVPF